MIDLLSSPLFHPVLSEAIESNVKSFKGIQLLSYTMGRCEKLFQFLEAEAQKQPMMLSEGIRTSKGGVINMTKRTMPFTEIYP